MHQCSKVPGSISEDFKQKAKGPIGCWNVPSIWEEVRSYVAGGRNLKLLRASCFWVCGEGGCLGKRSCLLEFLPEDVESIWWLSYN